MPRGPGTPRYDCYCRNCRQMFKAKREDALTCSPRCRKAWNRLMGGDVSSAAGSDGSEAVTDKPGDSYRVLLNGKWIASKPTRAEAELLVHGWLEWWDGEFTIEPVRGKKR